MNTTVHVESVAAELCTRGCKDPEERGISALPGDWWVGLGTGDERASMPWDMKVILSFGLKRGLDMHTD